MHPVTVYDAVLSEHSRASAARDDAHLVALRRREWAVARVLRPSRGQTRPSAARVLRTDSTSGAQPQRPTADERSAADGRLRVA